jgi:ABC-type uncharacterized transport system substrate-binding protein
VAVSDPVGQGFVDSLARPGGNVTGLTFFEFSVIGKMLNTLKQIAPTVSRVALAFNPASLSNPPFLRAIEAAAPTLAVELIEAPTREVCASRPHRRPGFYAATHSLRRQPGELAVDSDGGEVVPRPDLDP